MADLSLPWWVWLQLAATCAIFFFGGAVWQRKILAPSWSMFLDELRRSGVRPETLARAVNRYRERTGWKIPQHTHGKAVSRG